MTWGKVDPEHAARFGDLLHRLDDRAAALDRLRPGSPRPVGPCADCIDARSYEPITKRLRARTYRGHRLAPCHEPVDHPSRWSSTPTSPTRPRSTQAARVLLRRRVWSPSRPRPSTAWARSPPTGGRRADLRGQGPARHQPGDRPCREIEQARDCVAEWPEAAERWPERSGRAR